MFTNRNAPCPCGSGKKYKKCCLEADRSKSLPVPATRTRGSMAEKVAALIDTLNQGNGWSEALEERSPDEVAYDNCIVETLRSGKSIADALDEAGRRYPDEALECTEETIDSIDDHYRYMLNDMDIKAKIRAIKAVGN